MDIGSQKILENKMNERGWKPHTSNEDNVGSKTQSPGRRSPVCFLLHKYAMEVVNDDPCCLIDSSQAQKVLLRSLMQWIKILLIYTTFSSKVGFTYQLWIVSGDLSLQIELIGHQNETKVHLKDELWKFYLYLSLIKPIIYSSLTYIWAWRINYL